LPIQPQTYLYPTADASHVSQSHSARRSGGSAAQTPGVLE